MTNTVLIKRSSTANSVPTAGQLLSGELAINYADGNLFFKNSSNVVTTIASNKFVSVTGNVTGNYFIGNGSALTGITASAGAAITNGTSNVTVASSSNVTVGVTGTTVATFASTGLILPGIMSATGNITGNYFLGNGSQLTGIVASGGASITNGTSNVVVSGSSNITANVTGSAIATWASTGQYVTGEISATGNITGGNIVTGGISGNITGANVISAVTLSATGNITGGNVLFGSGIVSGTGNITGGNIIGFSRPSTGTAAAGTAPILLTSGTNLTTAAAGAVEYDGSFFYATPQTTSGRQVINTSSYYVLSANAAVVGTTIATFFPGTTSIPLVASGVYDIEYSLYFLKNTAGTLIWTITNSTTVTQMHAEMSMSTATGVSSTNAANNQLNAQVANQTAASVAFAATGSISAASFNYMRMRINLVNASSTSLRLNVTNSAGTVTPLAGSYWRATRIASIGTLAA